MSPRVLQHITASCPVAASRGSRCERASSDRCRILPAGRQRRRALRAAGGRAPGLARAPAAGHRPRAGPDRPAATRARSRGRSCGCPPCRCRGYRSFRLGLPTGRLHAALIGHRADLVHLASPFVLGARGRRRRRPGTPADGRRLPDRRARLRPRLPDRRRWARPPRGGGCAASTTPPTAPSRRPRPAPRPARARHPAGVAVAAGGWTPCGSTRPGAAPRLRRALAPGGELSSGTWGGWPRRSGSTCSGRSPRLPGVRLVIVGDGPAAAAPAPGPAGGGVPRGPRTAPSWPDLREPGRVRPQPGRTRRSARRCRRRRPAACRWWRRPRAARWTWSITASPATWWRPATRRRSPPRWRGWPATRAAPARGGGPGAGRGPQLGGDRRPADRPLRRGAGQRPGGRFGRVGLGRRGARRGGRGAGVPR